MNFAYADSLQFVPMLRNLRQSWYLRMLTRNQ
jgi:hypothetical protein